jgi:uncharacterized DUF497 family protein
MTFEFDNEKCQTNMWKHGIDFDEAQAMWGDPNRVIFVARFQNEERNGIVARLGDRLWCAVYTHRGENIRIISVRRAREYEKDLYHNS